MRADSASFEGGMVLAKRSITWLDPSRPPICVVRQLSFLAMVPDGSCNSKTGSCNAPAMPSPASEGPVARIITRFGVGPTMMNPPMRLPSPGVTGNRVEMLRADAGTGVVEYFEPPTVRLWTPSLEAVTTSAKLRCAVPSREGVAPPAVKAK